MGQFGLRRTFIYGLQVATSSVSSISRHQQKQLLDRVFSIAFPLLCLFTVATRLKPVVSLSSLMKPFMLMLSLPRAFHLQVAVASL